MSHQHFLLDPPQNPLTLWLPNSTSLSIFTFHILWTFNHAHNISELFLFTLPWSLKHTNIPKQTGSPVPLLHLHLLLVCIRFQHSAAACTYSDQKQHTRPTEQEPRSETKCENYFRRGKNFQNSSLEGAPIKGMNIILSFFPSPPFDF